MLAVVLFLAVEIFIVVVSAYMVFKWGHRAFLAFVTVLIGALVFGSGAESYSFAAPFVIGGAGGLTFRLGKPFSFFLIAASLFMAASMCGNFYYLKTVKGNDLIAKTKIEVIRMIDAYTMPDDQKKLLKSELEEWSPTAERMVPFLSFLYAMFFSGFFYIIIRKFITRVNAAASSRVAGLEMFRLDEHFILVLIGGWALFLLVDKNQSALVNQIGLNTGLIASVLYFIQALGVIKYKLIKSNLPGYLMPLLFLTMIFLGSGILFISGVMLAAFGALDLWADFRKLKISNNIRDGE